MKKDFKREVSLNTLFTLHKGLFANGEVLQKFQFSNFYINIPVNDGMKMVLI